MNNNDNDNVTEFFVVGFHLLSIVVGILATHIWCR